jgi:hypothetical protein
MKIILSIRKALKNSVKNVIKILVHFAMKMIQIFAINVKFMIVIN